MGDTAAYRIALITSSFAPHIGGVEEHVAQVARELTARGHVVEVWTVDRGERPERPFDHGVIVRYLPTPLPARALANAARFAMNAPPAWRAWAGAHRSFRPDIMHVHCYGPNGLYAQALHQRFHTPLVVTSHGETRGDDTSVFSRSALLRHGLRRSLADAFAVTAPTEYVLADLRDRFGLEGGRTVPNGVDLDVRVDATAVSGRYVMTARRLGWMKGVDLLIAAFARARATGRIDDMVRLVVAGDGPERGRIEEQIRAVGLQDVVLMLGWQDPDQVASLVAGADAVVVPSRDEAFGIAALEAWRGRTPLIMTTRGGAREFMTDREDAFLVDPEDVERLAQAIATVLSDAELRASLSEAGSKRLTEFTWSAVVDRYEEVYAEVP